jgi:hypothetical protein
MEIEKFKLITDGHIGIEVWGYEHLRSKINPSFVVIDPVYRKRRLPCDPLILERIKRLKYYLFNISGHWVSVFNKYFDHETMAPVTIKKGEEPKQTLEYLKLLFNRTKITGARLSETGFLITAVIEAVERKPMGISTPLITQDDDFGFYADAVDEISKIFSMLEAHIALPQLTMGQAKDILELHGISAEAIKDKTEKEVEGDAVNLLESKGFILISPEETDRMIEGKKTEGGKLSTSQKNIDGKNLPVAEVIKPSEISPAEDDVIIPAEPVDDQSIDEPPISDLANLEYSKNMPLNVPEEESETTESW